MNKKIAFDNRLCYEREVLRQHAIHQRKLQTLLPTCQSPSKVYLDSNAPSRQPHVVSNRKKLQLEKERQTEIYAQNQRLAAKMENISNRQENVVLAAGTPGGGISLSPRGERSPVKPIHSPAHVHMPGIRLNSSQTPMVDCYLSTEFAMGRGTACKKTTLISRNIQKQRQQHIEDENRRFQERIKTQKPYYNTKKWDADWQRAGAKYQHLHQDATIGYLLPRTSHGPPRSPLAPRRVKTRDGLPLLEPKTNHGTTHSSTNRQSRGGRLRQRHEANKDSKIQGNTVDVLRIYHEEEEEVEDGEPEVVECESFSLLHATTRKGVEVCIEELQIELRDAASGSVQPGDRGLLVRGYWGSGVEAKYPIALEMLTKVALEIDDLEMMIKLETVSTLSGGGNVPRLSSLLTEDELQRLLLKLVQELHVELLDNETRLVISSRLHRSPIPTVRDNKARPACRPRTCPSSLQTEPIEFSAPGDDTETVVTLDIADEKTQQYHRVLCKQLGVLLNKGEKRTGVRPIDSGYCLVQYWFHAVDSALHVTMLSLRHNAEAATRILPLDSEQVITMLEQLQHHETTPMATAMQFICARITTTS